MAMRFVGFSCLLLEIDITLRVDGFSVVPELEMEVRLLGFAASASEEGDGFAGTHGVKLASSTVPL